MRLAFVFLFLLFGRTSGLDADQASVVKHVETDRKWVALTFDDGPDAQTSLLAELIEAEGGRATFFVVGKNIGREPEILRRTARAGHEIGNHSFTHANPVNLSPEETRTEVVTTQDLIEKITGRRPTLFRAPFLSYTEQLMAILDEERLHAINANVHSRDWNAETSAEEIVERVTTDLAPGSIVLMHSWPVNTLAAMPEILRILRERGYRLVTVSELMTAPKP